MQLRRYKVALGLAAAMLILSLPFPAFSDAGLAFTLSLAMVATVLWVPCSLILVLFRRTGRADRLARLAIWIPTLVLAFVAMSYRDSFAREQASAVASAVTAYKSRTGSFPKTLLDVGHDSIDLRRRFSLAYRVDPDGKAALFYSQPSMPTIAHHYDFNAGTWENRD
jgi:hypothetical protein